MKIKSFLLAVVIIFSASLFSFSQTEGIEKGDREVTFNGFLFTTTGPGSSFTSGTFNFSYGYYLTNKFLFGIGPGITISYFNDFDIDVNASLYFNYNFFTNRKTIPYVSLQYFQSTFDPPSGSDLLDYAYIQGGLGVKSFLNEFVAFDLRANYGLNPGNTDIGLLYLSTGFSFIF